MFRKEGPKLPLRLSHFSLGEGSVFLTQSLLHAKEHSIFKPTEQTIVPYKKEFEDADRFIGTTIATAFPRRRNSADLLNEVSLLEPNADHALNIINGTETVDPRLRFETIRKMLLAGISHDLDERSDAYHLKSELHDVHALLNEELFYGKRGQTWKTVTYATHDNTTNTVLHVGDVYPMFVAPHTHVKRFEQQMRYVEDVGFVLNSVREKSREASIAKALRRSVQQHSETGNDQIDPLGTVKDAMGLQFVVKGTMNSFDPKVNVLKEKVLSVLRKKYGEVTIKKDNKTTGKAEESIQSPTINYQRLIVDIPGFPIPLELMFYGEADYINNKYHTGGYDRRKKKHVEGAGHSLYETRRIMQILPVIYPETVDGQVIPGYVGLKEETERTIEEKSTSLRRSNKIKLGTRLRERQKSRKENRERKRQLDIDFALQ